MIQYQRPAVPVGFEAKVGPARKAVAAAIRARKRPDFPELWADYKAAFADAQQLKCAYCELFVTAGHPGAVEHVAPKGAVRVLSTKPEEWGAEVSVGTASLVRGSRKGRDLSDRGYWWLAYDWRNYVLSCTVCNSTYKGSYYPLHPVPKKGWRPSQRSKKHAPLLLGCFDDPAPWRHFEIARATGAISGTTPRGVATVATCGLFRESLRQARHTITQQAYGCLQFIARDPTHPFPWRSLVELGGADRLFAGAVRTIAEKELAQTWEQITAFAATLPP